MNLKIIKLYLLWFVIMPQSLADDVNIKTSKSSAKYKNKFKVHFMEANTSYNFKPLKSGFFEKHLITYCYIGQPKTLGRLLESIELQLEIENDDYTQYEGKTPEEVEEHYSKHRSILSLNLFTQKCSRIPLSPFMQQCIGIDTVRPYNVTLYQNKTDFYLSIRLLTGIMMFMFAGILSTNSLFYYITGILVGICSSFLLLIWLSGKLMPKRTMMYGVLIGGWTLGFYVIRTLWNNIQMIMLTYHNYVCWYIIITGLISFLVCYRWGPPKDRRSKNIIKWLLQLMSLATIYLSSNFKEAIIAIMVVVVILYYFPSFFKKPTSYDTSTRNSVESLNQKSNSDNNRVKELRMDCQQCRLNSCKVTQRSRFPVVKNSIEEKDSEYSEHSSISASGFSLEEQEMTKQKLYSLPDGLFILSEKPPIILTPRHVKPIYHRSAPLFINDKDEEDYTAKSFTHIPLAFSSQRLNSAASTSNLLFAPSSPATKSPSQHQRSSSAQRAKF